MVQQTLTANMLKLHLYLLVLRSLPPLTGELVPLQEARVAEEGLRIHDRHQRRLQVAHGNEPAGADFRDLNTLTYNPQYLQQSQMQW